MQYKLEWLYKNGKLHSTYTNTIEMAESKAKPFLEDENITLITITRCELVKVLKEVK